MRGLVLGGLLGVLLGAGFGGLAGLFGLLVQGLVIGLIVWLAIRFFRSRRQTPAMASGPQPMQRSTYDERPQPAPGGLGGLGTRLGGGAATSRPANRDEIGVGSADLSVFERRLAGLQDAYSREDYAALERIATPEMVSYLAEELERNASNGVRNEVSDVKLLQGDVAESWRERDRDYATVAMRYEAVDVTRERDTGRIVSGDDRPTESTEVWTFLRDRGDEWKLSAIQEA